MLSYGQQLLSSGANVNESKAIRGSKIWLQLQRASQQAHAVTPTTGVDDGRRGRGSINHLLIIELYTHTNTHTQTHARAKSLAPFM